MKPRRRFSRNPILFKTFELAERLGKTVAELEPQLSMAELAQWCGYDAYKAALQDQAIEAAKLKAKKSRKR